MSPIAKVSARTGGTALLLLGELAAMHWSSQPRACLDPRAGYNQLDVVDEEDEQCGSLLSLFIFAVLGVMTSRDDLDQQHVFPGGFCF